MSLVFKTPKSALNTTTGTLQNMKSGDCPAPSLTTESVEYTENGEYSVTTPQGYDGLSGVSVTVNIDTEAIADEAYAEGEADQKAKLTSLSVSSNGTYNREDGYNAVTVNVPTANLQSKEVTPTTLSSIVNPDSGYNGMDRVVVKVSKDAVGTASHPARTDMEINGGAVGYEEGCYAAFLTADAATVTQSGNNWEFYFDGSTTDYETTFIVTPPTGGWPSGFTVQPSEWVVKVSYSGIHSQTTVQIYSINGSTNPSDWVPANMESKSASYTANGTYSITPSSGYDGMSDVEVTVNVPSSSNPNAKGSLSNPYNTTELSSLTLTSTPVYVKFIVDTINPITDPETEELIRYDIAEGPFEDVDWIFRVNPQGGVLEVYDQDLEDYYYVPAASFPESWEPQGGNLLEAVAAVSNANVSGNIITLSQTSSNWSDANKEGLVMYDGIVKYSNDSVNTFANWAISNETTITSNGRTTLTAPTGYKNFNKAYITVNVPSSPSCPDWSTIGWDCNDVNEYLSAEVAYTQQKVADRVNNSSTSFEAYYSNDSQLVFLPTNFAVYGTGNSTFKGDNNLKYIPATNGIKFYSGEDPITHRISNVIELNRTFEDCSTLREITLNLTDYGNGAQSNGYVGSGLNAFRNCRNLGIARLQNANGLQTFNGTFYQCINLKEVYITGNLSNLTTTEQMFYGCTSLVTSPAIDTSNVTGMSQMFAGCSSLTTVAEYDATKVQTVNGLFGFNYNKCPNLTTLGGFTNLGKAFTGTNANNHTLDLQYSPLITYQSIMNIINNLAAPDDTTATDATLKLSATSYALLSASDIAVATAKNWTVTSA